MTVEYGTEIERHGRYVVIANGSGSTTTITLDEFEAMNRKRTTSRQAPTRLTRPLKRPEASKAQFRTLRKLLGERSGQPRAEKIRRDLNAGMSNGTLNYDVAVALITALQRIPRTTGQEKAG